jgi:hypothetical protein
MTKTNSNYSLKKSVTASFLKELKDEVPPLFTDKS